jgi:hypothetical protein
MTAPDPRSRLRYIYAWLAMTAAIALILYALHML